MRGGMASKKLRILELQVFGSSEWHHTPGCTRLLADRPMVREIGWELSTQATNDALRINRKICDSINSSKNELNRKAGGKAPAMPRKQKKRAGGISA